VVVDDVEGGVGWVGHVGYAVEVGRGEGGLRVGHSGWLLEVLKSDVNYDVVLMILLCELRSEILILLLSRRIDPLLRKHPTSASPVNIHPMWRMARDCQNG